MPTYDFVTVDVFTDHRFGGNPLAVFPDGRGLTSEQMQALAMEFNLSETTFVLPPDNPQHHAKVLIFTPRAEIPFAGHPNVGTGYVLACRDDNPPEHYVFEEAAGLVRVHVLRAGGTICGARIFGPRALSIDIGVPVDVVAEQMVACGILGILNFAPVPLNVPPSVSVVAVDLSVQLEHLAYKVQNLQGGISYVPESLRSPNPSSAHEPKFAGAPIEAVESCVCFMIHAGHVNIAIRRRRSRMPTLRRSKSIGCIRQGPQPNTVKRARTTSFCISGLGRGHLTKTV